MGDCVLTTPALELLRAYRPDLEVAIAVEDRFAELFDRPIAPTVAAIRGFAPRLALNLHGGTRSMWLTAASGASIRAGFGHHRYSWIYNAKIPRAQEILGEERPVHTAEHLASAMFYLGVPRAEIPRARLSSPVQREGRRAIVHPFASRLDKAWPAERFVAVCQSLASRGLTPVVLAGPGDDTSPFDRVATVVRSAPLAEVKSWISGAAIFVGNDSGPAHIAAAFGVPVVAIFGPSNPVTWAPWRTANVVLTSQGATTGVSIGQVQQAVDGLLAV